MATEIDAEALHNNFDTILVLDFGSQTSHLILRRLRGLSIYAEMLPCTTKLADLTWKPKGIILSGGPSSVYDKGSPHVDPAVKTSDFMSAEPYEFSFDLLKAMARRIANEVEGVSRVTYDLSSKPPGTIELA